jgi:Tfp pilus assembly protein PilF
MMNRIEKIREMLKESPDDSFLQHALALEYIREGNEAAAKQLFENILNREPSYVGSYYHLARLLHRTGEVDKALEICETGMQEAKKAGDKHAFNELRSLYEEMMF